MAAVPCRGAARASVKRAVWCVDREGRNSESAVMPSERVMPAGVVVLSRGVSEVRRVVKSSRRGCAPLSAIVMHAESSSAIRTAHV